MDDKEKIISYLAGELKTRDDIYAFWVEGSVPQGYSDEYSDIDLWICTDDSKIFTIYDDIETILSQISPIDFKYVVKNSGELGQCVYHLSGMSEFFTIDINTQSITREVFLTKGIDDANIIFDKKEIIKFKERDSNTFDMERKRKKLQDYYTQMRPSLIKNIRRGRKLEALYYYYLILRYATKFLRLKNGWPEKTNFDLKHIYRDIPKCDVDNLEKFYDIKPSELEDVLPRLKKWIDSL